MEKWLFTPPAAFLLVLFLALFLSAAFSRLSYKSAKKESSGREKSYACGEDTYDPMVQPDYSQFFPFAFFFTIAHAAALIISTVPAQTADTVLIALFYISAVIIGLFTLFWR